MPDHKLLLSVFKPSGVDDEFGVEENLTGTRPCAPIAWRQQWSPFRPDSQNDACGLEIRFTSHRLSAIPIARGR